MGRALDLLLSEMRDHSSCCVKSRTWKIKGKSTEAGTQARDSGSSYQDDGSGKWLNREYTRAVRHKTSHKCFRFSYYMAGSFLDHPCIWKVRPKGFAEEVGVGGTEREGSGMSAQALAWASRRTELPLTEMGKL